MHQIVTFVLAGYLGITGVLHLFVPQRFQPLVPSWWPAPRATVYLSGIAEVVLAVGLVLPQTRLLAGLAAAVMFVAYAGVHADGFRHVRTATSWYASTLGIVIRVATNLGYAAVAVYVALGT